MNINFNSDGLVPVITQDVNTKAVLMLAYMNQEAFNKTIETGKVHYYSRSRQALWLKGETSGHFQHVKKIMYDCDQDAILIWVLQEGVACHTGNPTCFHISHDDKEIESSSDTLQQLYSTIEGRRKTPKEGSYTNYLFDKGIDKILKKVGEEAAEVIIGAKNSNKEEMVYEISDLMYHLSVLMVHSHISWNDIFEELKKRR